MRHILFLSFDFAYFFEEIAFSAPQNIPHEVEFKVRRSARASHRQLALIVLGNSCKRAGALGKVLVDTGLRERWNFGATVMLAHTANGVFECSIALRITRSCRATAMGMVLALCPLLACPPTRGATEG